MSRSIGRCEVVLCTSTIGQAFRAAFHHLDGSSALEEALVCYECRRLCEPLREEGGGQLMMSEEGWIYPRMWMDRLGFLN